MCDCTRGLVHLYHQCRQLYVATALLRVKRVRSRSDGIVFANFSHGNQYMSSLVR